MIWWNIWTNRNQKKISKKEPQNIDLIVRNQIKEWQQVNKKPKELIEKANKQSRKKENISWTRPEKILY